VTTPTQHRPDEHPTQEHGASDDHAFLDDGAGQIHDDYAFLDDGAGQIRDDYAFLDDGAGQVRDDYAFLDDGEAQIHDDHAFQDDGAEQVRDDRVRVRPTIDPRIRERRIEVLRAAGRRRLRVTLVIASAIVVAGLGYLAVRSPLLAVDHIRVTGSQREPIGKIMRAAGVHKGQPMLFTDTAAAQRRIERLRWIAEARVRRDFPGTVSIDVTEYVPTAYVRMSGGKIALIASNGHVIALARAVPPHAVAVIGERVAPVVGSLLTPPEAAGVVGQLPAHLRTLVFAIDVGGSTAVIDLRAAAPAGTACRPAPGSVAGFEQLRLGSLDSARDKGVAALAVLDHLAGQPFNYIDVSVPQAPVSC